MMNKILYISALGLVSLLFQILLSDFLVIRGIRPDFMLILVLYVSFQFGSLNGVILGFSLGVLEDLISSGSLIGLSSLTKSISGFLIGRLKGKYYIMSPIVFHFSWFAILLLHFFIYVYFNYQSVLESNSLVFWKTYFYVTIYTLVFFLLFQLIRPISSLKAQEK